MPETSDALTADAIRRQVLLEGVKEDEWQKFAKYLRRIDKQLRERLSREGGTITTKARLKTLLADVTAMQKSIYEEYTQQLILDLDQIALTDAELEATALNRVVDNFETIVPAPEQVIAAYKNNPLSIRGQAYTLDPFLKDFTDKQIQIVNSAIQQGQAEGQTISQITKVIRGTRGNRFEDGELALINRNDRTMVRTAVQNSAEQGRQRIWDSNKDLIKGVEWVSTLDNRTTSQCRSLDGREFPVDKGPRPPLHPNCRSTTTPVLSERYDFLDKGARRPEKGADGAGTTSQDATYYSWLKTQPASFQNEVLGPNRGKLLRDGGLNSDEFSRLQLNRNFKPRTLNEMKEIAPKAFEDANI